MNIDEVWREYKKTKDIKLRNKLIVFYAPLVKYIAGRVYSHLPKFVSVQDLISSGTLGLIDAVEKFDLGKGVKFETYAARRIKGAILDFLRSMDWVPRNLRSLAKEIEEAYNNLEGKLHRTPTDEEVAREIGVSSEKLQSVLSQLSYSSILALDEMVQARDGEDEVSLLSAIEDTKSPQPAERYEEEEKKESLLQAVKSLPERERKIIVLYYYRGMTLREIGEILGVSESRVSQLHAKALFRLRNYLRRIYMTSVLLVFVHFFLFLC